MDKSWINLVDTTSQQYRDGLKEFIKLAFSKRPTGASEIACPCKECCNRYPKDKNTVWMHCIVNGFDKSYKTWTSHGETYVPAQDLSHVGREDIEDDGASIEIGMQECMRQMVHEGLGFPNLDCDPQPNIEDVVQADPETSKFLKLLKAANTELWEGCEEYTQLSFLVEIMHLKAKSRWPDNSFTELLQILVRAMPKSAKLPKSYYEAYKITADLGFGYKTWDACENDCMLFRNEYEHLDKCVDCGASRYKKEDSETCESGGKRKKVAVKKMWYFPLKPRLKRLYWCSETASLMRWHANERVDDGVLRHPADSRAWKEFDVRYPEFASEVLNVRLGLATDGFNPFRTMSISHSTWPVVLIPYNLPPWHAMKQENFILSVLVQGPKGPGQKLDVYLKPLIEELNELWTEGVQTYDVTCNQMFTLHASLMWTINDFPAYSITSGWVGKGEFACPACNKKPQARWLKHGRKWCYIGHRLFLHRNHAFRKNKHSFDGCVEFRGRPRLLSRSEVLNQVENLETEYKIEDRSRKRKREAEMKKQARLEKRKVSSSDNGWKKKSIFWELPYWEHNLVRHNLDVMHIEKFFCDNLLYTLLGIPKKSKDNLNARLDLKEMNIRQPLHPKRLASGKQLLRAAQFTMSKEDKDTFLKVLKGVKVPDGYSSNISRCVHLEDRNIWGLKSHDSYILMQQLLPLAVRKALPKDVVKPVIELANFYRQLCSKENTIADLEKLDKSIPITLSQVEALFPPSFYDIMEHLPVHLPEEALLAGPIQFRWMYPIEKFLLTLKLYVRNRAHPEASIAKAWVAEECMTFCSRYLKHIVTKSDRSRRNNDGGDDSGRVMGKEVDITLDYVTKAQAHSYILFNTEAIEPYLEMHLCHLRIKMPRSPAHQIQSEHNQKFATWFQNYVCTTNEKVPEDVKILALGPHADARRFKGYIVNGFCFRIKDVDRRRKSQNSGVTLKSNVTSFASTRDNNPVVGDVNFYGQLTDILEIRYTNDMKFVLFKCDWVDNRTGIKEDEFKFTLVNFNRPLYKENRVTDEPFILASQAEQVWYVQDTSNIEWQIVMRMSVRDSFDIYSEKNPHESLNVPQVMPFSTQQIEESATELEGSWVREGVEGMEIDPTNEKEIEEEMVESDDE